MAACHSIGDMVAFIPPRNSVYAKLNVQIAEIVAIDTKGRNETVKVHLYSPDSDKGISDKHAHKRPWYPLVKSDANGYEMQRERPRNLTRGAMRSRLIKELKVEDILPIPPLVMEKGNVISDRDQKRIREAVNNGDPQDLEVTGKKRKYVSRDPRKYWYVRNVSAELLKRKGVDSINEKTIRHIRVPRAWLKQALEEAQKHDPMLWVQRISNWQLEELRSSRSSALY